VVETTNVVERRSEVVGFGLFLRCVRYVAADACWAALGYGPRRLGDEFGGQAHRDLRSGRPSIMLAVCGVLAVATRSRYGCGAYRRVNNKFTLRQPCRHSSDISNSNECPNVGSSAKENVH